jgi:hypothetical protein
MPDACGFAALFTMPDMIFGCGYLGQRVAAL